MLVRETKEDDDVCIDRGVQHSQEANSQQLNGATETDRL